MRRVREGGGVGREGGREGTRVRREGRRGEVGVGVVRKGMVGREGGIERAGKESREGRR